MNTPKTRSIQNILESQFIKRSLIPIAIFGIILIALVYLFNTYQREENRAAIKTLTSESFSEIAMQTASNINRLFTSNQNALHQLSQTMQLLIQNREKLSAYNKKWVNKEGFFIYKDLIYDENRTPIYTTNLTTLTTQDYAYLSTLIHLIPSVKTCVNVKNDLITAAWINIGKYYSLSYPMLNPIQELSPNLDVTQYPFYYLADATHNPSKEIVFSSLYKEDWAIDSGELGAYLMPIYENNNYIGVIGFTLTSKAIAQTISRLKLPFNAYAMLVDKEGFLIASSDNQRSYKTFGINSFYELHNNKKHPNRHLMQIKFNSTFQTNNIIHKQDILGTNFKLIICANNSDVFKSADELSKKAIKLGAFLLAFLLLLYIFFVVFTKKSIQRIATDITQAIKDALNFSNKMGIDQNLQGFNTNVKELQELGNNLALTHHKLLDLINKDPQTSFYNLYQLQKDALQPGHSIMRLVLSNYHKFFYLYGKELVDFYIKTVSLKLASYKEVTHYRVHENEFALLLSNQNISIFETIFKDISNLDVTFNTIHFKPSLYSGIAMTYPLIEESGVSLLEAVRTHTKVRPLTCSETSNAKQKLIDNIDWATRVEHAFENDLFVPYFQPIFDLKSNTITKFEALVRLKLDNELISPYLFLQAINDIGKDYMLTQLMIQKVFAVALKFPDISFNINTSFHDLQEPTFLNYVDKMLAKYPISPKHIAFELLENDEIDENERALETIATLKQKGFKIAIDDFGTGHSNFAHLLSMRVDTIKIDGQFIKNIIKDPNSVTITKTITQFASLVGAQTVAEFVADASILKRVRQLGIDYAQGYVISPPLPQEQLKFILEKDFSYVSR